MNRDPDERHQPDGAAPDEFEAIVAVWRDQGDVPQWPDDEAPRTGEAPPTDLDDPTPARPQPLPTPPPQPAPPGDEEHIVPPEPPPLTRLGPPALVGLTLIALGLVLVITPGWVGIAEPYGLPLGLVGLAAGLGWLVLRLWPDPPDRGDEDDDGAVV